MSDDWDVQVEFMDGQKKTYPKVRPIREDGCLVLKVAKYYGASPVIKWVLPLANIREVEYK